MKKLFVFMIAVTAALSPQFAHADLVGTTVSGTFNPNGNTLNFFDPVYGLAPAVYGNSSGLPVVIGSGIEFGVDDGNILYTFDFSGSTLTVTNTVDTSVTENGFTVTFIDPGFEELITLNNTFAGLSAGLSGDVLTLTYAGTITPVVGDFGSADFQLVRSTPPAVPEPSTIALLGTGVLGLLGAARRRLF